MRPLVTFPDPEAAVVNFFKTLAIADTVTVKFPVGPDGREVTLADAAKHLQVELEVGGVQDFPVTERAQVRVTCYAGPGRRGSVKDLASLAQGHLYALAGGSDVLATAPLAGRSDVITDPATKNLMVWFTFRVSMKATLLAS